MGQRISLHHKLDQLTRAAINIAGNGDNAVIALGTTKFYIYALWMIAGAAVNATFKDGAGGTALSGAFAVPTTSLFLLPFTTEPWLVISSGNAFNINLSAGQQVSGMVYYTTGAGQA